jgi:hypothetical protein
MPFDDAGTEYDTDADVDRIRSHVEQLLLRYDAVRIFVSRTRPTGGGTETIAFSDGGGNLYAQVGQTREWLTAQDERVRQHVREDN